MFKKSISLLLVTAVIFTLFNFTPAVTQIIAADTAAYQVAIGEKITITSTKTGKYYHNWSSSDSKIATVTFNSTNPLIAEVSGVADKAGTVVITHSYKDYNYSTATTRNETFTVHFGDPVDKTVHWVEEGKTAEIIIQSVQTKEATAPTPKVLFLGSLCTSHSLTTKLLAEAINNLAKVADVDYYMYGLKMSDLSASNYPLEGTIKKGGSISENSIKGTAQQMHICLFYFAEILGALDLSEYDLIVLEFDGVRMANMGSYSNNTGLTQQTIVDDLNKHYAKATYNTTAYADPSKNTVSGYSKHYGKTITWNDILADLADAAYNLIPAYKENKVAWLLPKPIAEPTSSQYTVGAKMIYDDYAFLGRKYNVAEAKADANLKREAWDALAIMAPETWLAKDASGNYIKQKAAQPSTETDINAAVFANGTPYHDRASAKFSDGVGMWTTYDDSKTILELLDAKTYDLIHYENVNIQDYIAQGFKVTGVRGEYLNETVNPPVWTEVTTASGNFSYTVEGDYVDANFNLKALRTEKTRVIIQIETTEEIIYEEVSGEKVVATNKGEVKVIYDGDEEHPVVDDPPVLPEPSVDITKISKPGNGNTAFVGNDISYMFAVKNIGSVDITKVVVTDPTLKVDGSDFTYTYSQTLAPGKTLIIIGEKDTYTPTTGEIVVKTTIPKHTVSEADLTNGKVDNKAFVEVTLKGGTKSYDESDISNPVKEKAFTIEKESDYEGKASGKLPDVGTTINYTVTVKNVSSRTISDVMVKDSLIGAEAVASDDYVIDSDDATIVTIPTLTGGATATIKYTYKVTAQDVLLYSRDGLQLINYATVSADDEVTETASCSDKLTALTVNVNVEKIWEDNNDQDGKRPDSVEVQLYKKVGNAQEVAVTGQKKNITSNDTWKTTFTDLPMFENGFEIVYSVVETKTSVITGADGAGTYKIDYSSSVKNDIKVTNTHTPEKVSVNVSKVWDDNNNQDCKRPDSVEVQLYTVGADESLTAVTGKKVTLDSKNEWKAAFTDLDKYNNKTLINYTVKEVPTDVITGTDGALTYSSQVKGNMADGFVITNKHTPTKISVSVEKEWNDDNNRDGVRPQSVEIKLYKKVGTGQETYVDGKVLTLSSTNQWKDTFADLPEFEGGKTISYSVKETTTNVITGTDGAGTYAIEVTGNMTDGFKVKNTHTPEVVSVKVTKKWTDGNNQDGIRPDGVDVCLTYYTTSKLDTVADLTTKVNLSNTNSWTHTYENLYKYSNGTLITYGIDEFKAGVVTGTDKAGEYAISITSKNTNDIEVENIHTPETLDTTVTIDWDDNENQDGIRPESVEVKLYKKVGDAQETLVDGKTLTITGDDWTADLKDLPKYEGGVEITYIVKETTTSILNNVDGAGTYAIDVAGGSSNGFVITNLHTPEKVSYNVTKVWADNSDQDGIRPESVEIKLYKKVGSGNETLVDGEALELKDTNSWKGAFTDLDKYEGGVLITYSVKETATAVITGTDGETTYESEVSYTAEDGFKVTNTHTPSVFDFTVKAEWDDDENQDGIRPDTVVVQLYKKVGDGSETEVTGSALTLTKDGGFTDKFENLPKYEGGETVTYTVKEVTTDVLTGTDKAGEYKIEIKETTTTGTTFKNVHTPETVIISVEKVWKDADNQDGIRPEDVEIVLLKSVNSSTPAVVADKTLTLGSTNSWKDSFENLPKYEGGFEISYTVDETKTTVITDKDTDDTYKAEISKTEGGFKVTNTHTPAVFDFTVKAEWDDAENQDGIRPESVVVQLYKKVGDGSETEVTGTTITITKDGGYTDKFENLPKFEGGKAVTYSAKEVTTDVLTGTDKAGEYKIETKEATATGTTFKNVHTPETVSVSVEKVWEDADNQDGIRPEKVEIILLKSVNASTPKVVTGKVLTLSSTNSWKDSFTNLPKYEGGFEIEYLIDEVKTAVITDDDTDDTYEAEVSEADDGYKVTNTHTPAQISVFVENEWNDADNQDGIRPESVEIELYKKVGDNEPEFITSVVLSETNSWQYSFDELDKFENGTEIKYFVEEKLTSVITGEDTDTTYSFSITGNQKDGYKVTNLHTPATVTISGHKTWNDAEYIGKDGYTRPSEITLHFYGKTDSDPFKAHDDIVLTADDADIDDDNQWNFEIVNLPKFKDGIEIEYSVTETSVDGFMEAEIEDFNVTNTPKEKTESVTETSVTIKKEDGLTDTGFGLKGAKFKLELNLNNEYVALNGIYITDDNGELKLTFTAPGTYRLTETKAPDGYVLTDPAPYFDIVVEKEFVNVEFDSENDVWVWNYKLVADKTVNDYLDDNNAVVLKNNPETISVNVSKVWNDADNQDGFRAEAVKVQLLMSIDGGEFEVVEDSVKTLDETNGWKAVYENLVKFQDTKEIVYKVNEIFEGSVTGEDAAGTYGVAIAGDEETGFVITNTHTAETTEIDIKVIWEDENNKYNDRPEQITVTIYQEVDGEVTKVMDVVITGGITDDFWTKVISDLPVYSNGQKIKYILDSELLEVPVDYDKTLEDFTITNVHAIPRPTGDESIAVWCILMCAAVALLSLKKDDKRFRIKL